jgi:hypothetical protein
MVIHMNELVREGVLHVLFVHEVPLTKNDCTQWTEPSCTNGGTRHADYVVCWDMTARLLQVFEHKCHSWA